MKKPLCLLCLTFVVVLAVCMQLMPMPVPDYEILDGQWLTLQGQVYRKEYKEHSGSEPVWVLYLESVHIYSGLNEESDEAWNNLFKQFPNYEIKNIMCYLSAEADGAAGQPPVSLSAGKTESDTVYHMPAMGETVLVNGQLRSFSHATNPGEFDVNEYYQIMGIEFALKKARIQAEDGKTNMLEEGLYRLQQYFGKVLEHHLPTKEASVMKAMLLGDKSGLDEETKELYQRNSIIHILSISGMHITIIGMGIYRLLKKSGLPVQCTAALSMAFIYCYGLMTGMSMSAARAIFMFCLHLLADIVGRTYDMMTALSVAAVLLLAEQPRYIYYSGFQFSFIAVAALGILYPVLYKAEKTRSSRSGVCANQSGYVRRFICTAAQSIRPSFWSGMAVTLATLPVHLTSYYQFPLFSILLNLAVIPLMTLVMFAGLIILAAGGWFPWLAELAAYADRSILRFYEEGCLLGDRLSGSVLQSGRPEDWQVAVYVLLLMLLVGMEGAAVRSSAAADRHGGLPEFVKYQWILAALCILFLRTESGLQITMLDAGQGDCIHICSENGSHYLIDAGSSTKSNVMEYQILPYLQFRGISHLNAVFITHSDSDHCSGMLELLEEYRASRITIGSLILPAVGEESRDEQYRKLEALARGNGIRVQYMSRGQKITDGEMTFYCIHPYEDYETQDTNEYSLVLLLTYDRFTGLFTGDIQGRGEEIAWEYLRRHWQEYMQAGTADDSLTLLKVAHHGSRYSTSEEMLECLQPYISLISCGKNNVYHHPHEELLERLVQSGTHVYTTPECGAITLEADGGIKVKGYK